MAPWDLCESKALCSPTGERPRGTGFRCAVWHIRSCVTKIREYIAKLRLAAPLGAQARLGLRSQARALQATR